MCGHVQHARNASKPRITQSQLSRVSNAMFTIEVWQIDLYGPLPSSTPQAYTYVLTAVDMFSKYLVTVPLANKDTLSVASGLMQILTKYGVCSTLIPISARNLLPNACQRYVVSSIFHRNSHLALYTIVWEHVKEHIEL